MRNPQYRAAAALLLKVAPARSPRVANPEPVLVEAYRNYRFWYYVAAEGWAEPEAAATAAQEAAVFPEGFTPFEWQTLRSRLAALAA